MLVSALLTWGVRKMANAYGLAYGPVSGRHIHTRPIPRMGGVAIFLTFISIFSGYLLLAHYGLVQRPVNTDIIKILMPGAALFVVGLLDDLRELGAKTKLLIQIGGGATLHLSGLHLVSVHWDATGPLVNSAICFLITVFWVVLICNAVNLIDGLDGLASGSALFSMVTIFTVALVVGRPGVAMATTILAGAMLGFLIFNFNPASIFLGDSGSLFVGFLLSGLVLAEAHTGQRLMDSILMPLISFALPLAEVVLSVLRRFLSGHALFGADREHIHHKLLDLGLTHRQVVGILYLVSAGCSVLSLFLLHPSHLVLIPVASIMALLLFFGLRTLKYHEFAEFRSMWQRTRDQKEALARNIAVRKATARLYEVGHEQGIERLLEGCLKDDFDGFEIVLSQPSLRRGFSGILGNGSVGRFWNDAPLEKMVMIVELSTPQSGLLGQFLVYRSIETRLLIDLDLLTGELRNALSVAIENCVEPVIALVGHRTVFEEAGVISNPRAIDQALHLVKNQVTQ
jgi:UDP-GlcNAc:undecaprenyl-phosphate GlcNAc-1-phosphate transferase